MKKNNTNSFVAHLENKDELLEEMERQQKKQIALQEETLDKMDQYQKGMVWVYAIIVVLLLGIAFFWWNISRGQFYAALKKPFDNSAVESLLYEINTSKNEMGVIDGEEGIDWDLLIEEVKNDPSGELSSEEELLLNDLVDQLQSGKSVQEIMVDFESVNLEE